MTNSFLEKIKVLCASYFLKFIYITNRKDVRGRSHYRILLNEGKSVILSAWHGQLLTITHDLANENFHAIAGTHRDAELISQIATKWGWLMLRGSSKEKGNVAYKDMIRSLKQSGSAVFITPDGPTGPARIPKPGVIRAAQITGAAIIPIGVHSTLRWEFKNWDTFYVEKPLGKIYIEYGEPIYFTINENFEDCSQKFIEKMEAVENNNLQYTNNESP
ncbi:MAG: lysophospholipid acyltransferase family protein [Candidatus Neomarinimicrobiota bacterium]|nr:lysophospholipid acyltransferase family protein [Candidatus Neomarinimicrobiota bacterium]|tara:strand:- start:15 stop:668 length:654 start_codon:yes stop_codon:yes gene_type:complete